MPISRPIFSAIARTASPRATCAEGSPWEKFNRTTSTPARNTASSISGGSVAGPKVATMRVRRWCGTAACSVLRAVMCAGSCGGER
jgi:hypothetical protein